MRTVLSLNENWTFRDNGETKTVTLPHTWSTAQNNRRGKRFYSRTVSVVPEGRVILSFESVGSVCDVFMDGIRIGGHAGGGARFRFDVTGYVRHNCMLTVAVDDTAYDWVCPSAEDAFIWGGIYGDVQLIVTGELRFSSLDYASDGVYVTPVQRADGWYLGIKTLLDTPTPEGKVRYTLTDGENEVIVSCEKNAELPGAVLRCGNVRIWDGRADAYLYFLTAEAITPDGKISDSLRIPVGFRSFSFDAQDGFLLNGRKTELHGLIYRRERPEAGIAVREENLMQDTALLLETGADIVRCPEQMPPFFMELCDNSGLLAWADLPVYGHFTSKMQENAKQRLLELIKQNYNHPSVCCWSFAAEIHAGQFGQNVRRHAEKLSDIAKTVDTTRPLVQSMRLYPWMNGLFADVCFDSTDREGLIDGTRTVKRDDFYLYKAMWGHDETMYVCGGTERECPVGETELKIYTDLPAVKVTAHGKTYVKTGKAVFIFPEIPVLPGMNEYTVYADGIMQTIVVYGIK